MDSSQLGRLLVLAGVAVVLIGAWLAWGPKIPWIGKLPGDFSFGGQGWRVHVPLGTSLVVSLVLTLHLTLLRKK